MTTEQAGPTTALTAALTTMIDDAFAMASEIAEVAAAGLAAVATPRRSALVGVEELVRGSLVSRGTRLQGAGFVAAVGLLDPERWWLEWFAAEDDDTISRLDVDTDPTSMGFHDYEPLEWFDVPRRTGVRHITGPYVDNVCTDDYTLTFTQPVLCEGRFVGVAGADVGVRTVEKVLLPALRAIAAPTAVVNADGRTLVSNTGALMCGDLIGTTPVASRLQIADLPLSIATLAG